jgi:hypothetical protein
MEMRVSSTSPVADPEAPQAPPAGHDGHEGAPAPPQHSYETTVIARTFIVRAVLAEAPGCEWESVAIAGIDRDVTVMTSGEATACPHGSAPRVANAIRLATTDASVRALRLIIVEPPWSVAETKSRPSGTG